MQPCARQAALRMSDIVSIMHSPGRYWAPFPDMPASAYVVWAAFPDPPDSLGLRGWLSLGSALS
jgi:hypothetical protein